jgi:hypothetical protein
MKLKHRLEKLEKQVGQTSRSPVAWASIVDGQLIGLGLRNGMKLTGPVAQKALEEAQRVRDPYKVYFFDPSIVDPRQADPGLRGTADDSRTETLLCR